MSIDITDLMILIKEGTPTQMRYAEVLLPIRRDGNRLLSTILLSNVAANSLVTVFLGDLLANGWQTFIISTLTLCLIGEIVPQALFNRHGFILAAKSIYFIRFLLFITLPFSYPIGLALDAALGDEAGSAYTRKQIRYLIELQYEKGNLKLHETELNILQSALTISKIRVDYIMTDLNKVFMLNINSNLDFETLSMIIKSGYTRIPLYHNDRSNIVGVINAKDLSLINPNDNLPVETFCSYYNRNLLFVPNDTSIIKMLQEFIKGKTHLAFVYHRGIKVVKEQDEINDQNNNNKFEQQKKEISDDTLLDNLLLSSSSSSSNNIFKLEDENNNKTAITNSKRKTILKMGSLGDSGIFMVSSNEDTDILNAAVKKIIGIVTLEDIFAMIIQQEIFDEKDLDLTTSKY
jgi:CBS domain containing-hemolysin-like protein